MIPRDWTELDSSYLHSAKYDVDTGSLYVRFKDDKVHLFKSVPKRIVTEMLHSSSPGKHFREHIRDAFESEESSDGKAG